MVEVLRNKELNTQILKETLNKYDAKKFKILQSPQ